MKLNSRTFAALLSLAGISSASASLEAKIAQAAKDRQARELQNADGDIPGYACFSDDDFTVYFKGKCTFDDLVERMSIKVVENDRCVNSGKEEVMLLVGVAKPSEEYIARARIAAVCKEAMDFAMTDESKSVRWSQVANKGSNFDKQYYDGNTFWNEEYQTNYDSLIPGEPSNKLKRDGERIDDLYETVAERLSFQWPGEIENFQNCDLRAAMCCWSADRQANDNNGNCATPYDERCTDADPADNTELCAVDMGRSGQNSIYMEDGVSFFQGDIEGPVHCHGFAWGHDETEADYRYAANNLFYVSMYDHLYQRGYVRNIPGAPMCGCVEKMPVVSRADCTEIEAHEFWKFEWDADAGEDGIGELSATLDRAEIDFNACRGRHGNNDLERFYDRLYHEGRATLDERMRLKRHIAGNDRCEEAREETMYRKGYEVAYPEVPIKTDGTLYSIKVSGGTNTGRELLFTQTNGDVRLISEDSTGNAYAQWRFVKAYNVNSDISPAMFQIRLAPNVLSNRNYLFSDHNGGVRMDSTDNDSGNAKWFLQKVPEGLSDYPNEYYIKISGGVRQGETFLSTSTSGNPDLEDKDDDSGTERWIIEELTN